LFFRRKKRRSWRSAFARRCHNPRGIDPDAPIRYKERSVTVVNSRPSPCPMTNLSLASGHAGSRALENVITLHTRPISQDRAEPATVPTRRTPKRALHAKGGLSCRIFSQTPGSSPSVISSGRKIAGFFWQFRSQTRRSSIVISARANDVHERCSSFTFYPRAASYILAVGRVSERHDGSSLSREPRRSSRGGKGVGGGGGGGRGGGRLTPKPGLHPNDFYSRWKKFPRSERFFASQALSGRGPSANRFKIR